MTVERVDREDVILTRLADRGSLSVTALATELGVSEVTVRSDLRSLEQQGMLTRTRGGARPTQLRHILQRQRENTGAKERIAAAAAALVADDDTVMIEAGTTTALIVRHLTGRRGVQLVTNSTLVFNNARVNPALAVHLTGGTFDRATESLVGPLAERAIFGFNTQLAFLGTDGFSPDRGLTTRFAEGARVSTVMRQRATETWLVADSSKFGHAGFVSFLSLADITGIITDSALPADAADSLRELTRLTLV